MRLARAEARWLDGQTELARTEAEQADDVAEGGDSWERGAVAVWLRRCGSLRPVRGELAEPYQRQIEGYPEKAAQLWTDLGCRYEAALAQYDAAGEQPLREALAIFTDAGRVGCGPDHPAEDARARHQVDPGRPARRDPGRSAGLDSPRA